MVVKSLILMNELKITSILIMHIVKFWTKMLCANYFCSCQWSQILSQEIKDGHFYRKEDIQWHTHEMLIFPHSGCCLVPAGAGASGSSSTTGTGASSSGAVSSGSSYTLKILLILTQCVKQCSKVHKTLNTVNSNFDFSCFN